MNKVLKVLLGLSVLIGSLGLLTKVGLPYEAISFIALSGDPYATPKGNLEGKVLFSETDTPIQNASVHVYKNQPWSMVASTFTNENGEYKVSDLEEGYYTVFFYGLTPAGNYDFKEDVDYIYANQTTILYGRLTAPVPPLATVPDTGGGSAYTDPSTGEVWLNRPQSDVKIVVPTACDDTSKPTNVTLAYAGNTYSMHDNDGDGKYEATIPATDIPDPNNPPSGYNDSLVVNVICGGNSSSKTVGHITLYDPSGLITNEASGQPIVGATVTLFQMPGLSADTGTNPGDTNGDCRTVNTRPTGATGDWSGLPPADSNLGVFVLPTSSLIEPKTNPQLTADNGRYGWDVATGCWYITVSAPGYISETSPAVGVPPEVTDLNIALEPANKVFLPLITREE